jgi:hypothetical protein
MVLSVLGMITIVGEISVRENVKYLVAVALLAVLAVVFGLAGTVAPFPESTLPSESSSSAPETHFMYPPSFDSGWENITSKTGQYFSLRHDLNTTEVFVDIRGKQSLDITCGELAWNKTYGDREPDEPRSFIKTTDGGYALAGYTLDDWVDFWFVKTDSDGNQQWNKTYGTAGYDYGYSVIQTIEGGYALAGYTDPSSTMNYDCWLIKTNSTGAVIWSKTYGGANKDYGYCVIQTTDGGYALVGSTDSSGAGYEDFWLIKTDSDGNHLWNKTYGGARPDYAYSVVQTNDGGYAIAGVTESTPWGPDFWLVKTDSTGEMLWNKVYGRTKYEYAFSLISTSDGGFALAGTVWTGNYDFGLVKTDSDGNLQWNKTYGGGYYDEARSVIQTMEGGYALVGCKDYDAVGGPDCWLVRTDSTGEMLWNKTYGGATWDYGYCVAQTVDEGYAIAGSTETSLEDDYNFWLIKVNAETHLEHQRNLGTETGLTCTGLTNRTIILYRGSTDPYWNYVRVRIWIIKEPTWQFGDINQDGVVDVKDLYILSQNYGKTFSLLSLSGIIAIAGVHTYKKRKQQSE